MIRTLGLLALFSAITLSAAPAQDLQGPKWTPLEFSVKKPEEGEKGILSNSSSGTRIIVRLDMAGQTFIALDEQKSKVDSFTDDKGTDLLAAPAPRFFLVKGVLVAQTDTFRSQPNDLTFHAPGCLASGATKVRVKGTAVVIIGKSMKEAELKNVALKGINEEVGPFKVQPAKESDSSGPGTT